MKLIRVVDRFLLQHMQYTHFYRFYVYYRWHKWVKAKEQIHLFLGEGVPQNQMRWHVRKMRHAYIHYFWDFDEYFLYHYNLLSDAGRKKIVTEMEVLRFTNTVNPPSLHYRFRNKGETYKYYSNYYHREVCVCSSWEQSGNQLMEFVKKHSKVIFKPLDLAMGKGIMIVDDSDLDNLQDIVSGYKTGLIAEELIKQHEGMAFIHPSSVNTLRVTTFIVDGVVHIIRPFARFGTGGNVVDNGAQGGLVSLIDPDSGIITDVVDEFGNKYVLHPDTKIPIVGYKIPYWQEALAMAEELARIMPEVRYVGWDLALTDNGWVMVEGNSRGQFIGMQLPIQKGVRALMLSIDPKCLHNYN